MGLTATSLDHFLIQLVSLDAADTPGLADNFKSSDTLRLKLAEFTAINGFDAALLRIDTGGFRNAANGGTWSVAAGSDGLYLDFKPAPEPASLALFGLGAGLLVWRRRRAGWSGGTR